MQKDLVVFILSIMDSIFSISLIGLGGLEKSERKKKYKLF